MLKTLKPVHCHQYSRVEDIDLYAGGMAEKVVQGGTVGPTFACIIGRQFHKLRSVDRYCYENPFATGFTTGRDIEEMR